MKRGFGVGTLEVSFEEGLEAIEILRVRVRVRVIKKVKMIEVAGGC